MPFMVKSQNFTLKGSVKDAKTKQGIPLVSILINKGQSGTTSDLNGSFEVDFPLKDLKIIEFNYIGYESFVYRVKNPDDLKPLQKPLNIILFEKIRNLEEVTIKAGENPAHRIIRKASAKRKENSLETLKSYKYSAYHKFAVTSDEAPENLKIKPKQVDSADIDLREYLKKHHILLIESVTDYQFLQPNNKLEKVQATKVSGFQNPRLLAFAANAKPLDFTNDFVQIFDKEYLNPLAKGSTERYFFNIEDTLYFKKDTVYAISFQPFPDKNILTLEGTLHIHTKNYAIQNILVNNQNQKETLLKFNIQQRNELVDESYWFPSQVYIDAIFEELLLSNDRRAKGTWRNHYKNFEINPELSKNNFSEIIQQINPLAHLKEDTFWEQNRKEPLNQIDKQSYKYLDSLGKKMNWDRILNISEALTNRRFSVGKYFDLDIDKLFKVNQFERFRLGVGFLTNDIFSSKFSIGLPYTLGAYIGYGFGDNRLKYGGKFEVLANQTKQLRIGTQYSFDLHEPAMIDFVAPPQVITARAFRNFLAQRMDIQNKIEIYATARPIRNLNTKLSYQYRDANTSYEYYFLRDNSDVSFYAHPFFYINNEVNLQLHYAKNEEYIEVAGQRILNKIEMPSISLNIKQGNIQWNTGQENYTKIETRFIQKHKFLYVGTFTAEIQAAQIFGNIPYPLLYNGMGTTGRFYPFTQGYFQTADIYEFVNSRFINIFLSHNIGKIFPKKWTNKHFNPELTLHQFFGIGSLNNVDSHYFITTNPMNKGLWESGLTIDKLYRYKYLRAAYLNLGAGVFARYGAYQKTDFRDNFAFKLSVNFEL
jgi:hypothetical protein